MLREKFTFYLQRFAVIKNYINNTLVSGTNGHDSIYNEGSNVTIISGTGNDTVTNKKNNDTVKNNTSGDSIAIDTGADNDYIYNEEGNGIIIHSGKGNDSIYNYGNYYIGGYRSGYYGSSILIDAGEGNDYVQNSGKDVTINAGAGDDSVYSSNRNDVSIDAGAGNNYVSVSSGSGVTINGGTGNDTIYGGGSNVLIDAGAGNDSISAGGANVTVTGGAGNDSIKSSGTNILFKYTEGDGNKHIEGMSLTDTLEISGSYSTTTSGENLIVTVGNGKITLVGMANEDPYIEGKKSSTTSNTWKLSGTTATYGTSKKTLVTVKGVKSTDGLSVKNKVVTVAASSLNAKKITLSGSGYTLKLADDVTKTSTKKAWSLSGTTATYKQTTKAGYKLASDKLSISYKKKATSTLATVYGVKSKSGFTLDDGTITLKTSSLSKRVSVSGSYAFEFTSDYKKAKITGSASADTIMTAGANMTINGGKGNDLIVSKGNKATITGGKGNDTLTGGKSADVFVYSSGDGNDVITNFDESDIISLKSGAAEISTSGNDVIFTVGKGKLTLKKASGKIINYVDASGNENFYTDENDDVEYNAKGTGATLKSSYSKDSFEPEDYSNYKDILVTINAAAVENSLQITGNKKANIITGTIDDDTIKGGAGVDTLIGGAGNDELYGEKGNDSLVGGKGEDSLWGGKGSDTLTGGGGKDVFFYDSGNGDDVITDYSSSLDKVIILSGLTVGNPTADSSGDITFKIGEGQITFQNSASKYIELVNEGGTILMKYNPS